MTVIAAVAVASAAGGVLATTSGSDKEPQYKKDEQAQSEAAHQRFVLAHPAPAVKQAAPVVPGSCPVAPGLSGNGVVHLGEQAGPPDPRLKDEGKTTSTLLFTADDNHIYSIVAGALASKPAQGAIFVVRLPHDPCKQVDEVDGKAITVLAPSLDGPLTMLSVSENTVSSMDVAGTTETYNVVDGQSSN